MHEERLPNCAVKSIASYLSALKPFSSLNFAILPTLDIDRAVLSSSFSVWFQICEW